MIECANIYPGPNLKMRRGRRPARGRAVPSRRCREGMEQGGDSAIELKPGIRQGGGDGERGGTAARSLSLDRTRQPRASAGAMPCAIRRREAAVCGGWQPWRARPHPPTFPRHQCAGRGPRATRHGRAALASPCPSVASAVALATARARLLLALCLPTCLPVSS